MTAQRSLSELDPAGISPQRVVASAAILQRMMLVSNAIAQGDPGERPVQSTNEIQAALFAFADGTVPAVDAVAELRRWHGMAVVKRPDDPLAGEIDALASQIEVLADENRLARP
jgi:hypothetical protein